MQPLQTSYSELVKHLRIVTSATSSRAIQAQQWLQDYTQNNSQVHRFFYQVIIDPNVQHNVKLLSSTSLNIHLINMMYQNPYDEMFSFARQIIRDSAIEQTYLVQLHRFFVELITKAEQGFIQQWLFMFKDLLAQNLIIKALTLMTYFTVAEIKDSDFIYLISMMVPWIVKSITQLQVTVVNSFVILEWSKVMCEVLSKLLHTQDEVFRQNVFMIAQNADIAKIVVNVYSLESDMENGYLTVRENVELNILKGSICQLHSLLLQIYRQTHKPLRETLQWKLLLETSPNLTLSLLLVAKDYDKYNQAFQCSSFIKSIFKVFSNALATTQSSSIFINFAQQLVVQAVYPALVFTDTEADSFKENSQEFVFYIEDIIDLRKSETIKGLASELLEQLCDGIPGILTQSVNTAINSIKTNLGIIERIQNEPLLGNCQALIVIGTLGYTSQNRNDIGKALGDFFAFNSEVILKTFSPIQLAVMYIVIDYTGNQFIFPQGDYNFVYIKHASICRVHPTTEFTALSFLSSHIKSIQSLQLLKILLQRTQNCGYGLVWTILQQYIQFNLKNLTEPICIELVTVIFAQIQKLRVNPTDTSPYSTLQCINIIQEICNPKLNYLKGKDELRGVIFQIFGLLKVERYHNVDGLILILNDLVRGKRGGVEEIVYQLFSDLDMRLQQDQTLYITLFPFLNCAILKSTFQSQNQRLLKILQWCLRPLGFKSYKQSQRAQSLLLIQLFLDKYLLILKPSTIIQTMSLLNIYNQKPSQPPSIIRLYITNVLFYNAPIEFPKIQVLKKLLSLDFTLPGYSSLYMKKLVVVFLFKIMYTESQLDILSLVMNGIVKVLASWHVKKEVKSTKKKQQIKAYNLEQYKESVLKLISPYKKMDIFEYFSDRVKEMKEKNMQAFTRIVETLSEDTKQRLKKILSLRQLRDQDQPRVIFKIKGIKEQVQFGQEDKKVFQKKEKKDKVKVDEQEKDKTEDDMEVEDSEERGVKVKKEKKKEEKRRKKVKE